MTSIFRTTGEHWEKKEECDACEFFFLLHTSDEHLVSNAPQSHFEIEEDIRNKFWIAEQGLEIFKKKMSVVLFTHEEKRCTAFAYFEKILTNSNSSALHEFIFKLQGLFDFHIIEKRESSTKALLVDLGY